MLPFRSRHGSPITGVPPRAALYQEHRAPDTPDDLSVLRALDPERLATLLQTRQRTSGTLKAAAMTEAARRLSAAGAWHAADLDPAAASRRGVLGGAPRSRRSTRSTR